MPIVQGIIASSSVATNPGYTAYRFQPTKLRTDATANSVQISEFQILVSGVRQSTATAYGFGINSPGGEAPTQANDNSLSTKWLNFNKTSGYLYLVFPTAIIATGYRIGTAGDAIERDPVSWAVYGSNNSQATIAAGTATWMLIDTKTDYAVTTTRSTYLTDFSITV